MGKTQRGFDLHSHLNKDKIRLERFLTIAFIYLTFGSIIEYYCNYKNLPFVFYYITQALSLFVTLLLILKAKIKITFYRLFFILSLFMLLGMSLHDIFLNTADSVYAIAIYIQLLSAFCFAKYDLDFWDGFFTKLSIISFVAMVYVFLVLGFDLSKSLNMQYGWTETFFYATLFWGVIPFVIMSVLTGKHIYLSMLYWACSVILNLIIQKRFIIVDSLMLVMVVIIISIINGERSKKFLRIFVAITITTIFSTFLMGDKLILIFDSVYARMLSTAQDISNFDRWVETKNYFAQTSLWEVLLGKGVLGIHTGLGTDSYALHIGWSNFILKGGFLLFALVLTASFKVLALVKQIKNLPLKIQFSLWCGLIYFIKLSYSNMHNFSPEMLLFFYCLFNVMDYKVKASKFNRKKNFLLRRFNNAFDCIIG